MITLSEAFKLCSIKNEVIYLRFYKDNTYKGHGVYSENLKKYADFSKIKVFHITEHFAYENSGGWEFLVNIKEPQIQKMVYEIERRYVW